MKSFVRQPIGIFEKQYEEGRELTITGMMVNREEILLMWYDIVDGIIKREILE